MKITHYVETVERDLHALLGNDGDRLLVVPDRPLPREAQQALAGYADQLVEFFQSGVDRDLNVLAMHRNLEALGLVQIREMGGCWTHPEGDHVADRIIAGVIAEGDAERDAADRAERGRREAEAFGQPRSLPRRVDADVKQIRPGTWTWTERAGDFVRDPFPTIPRIKE